MPTKDGVAGGRSAREPIRYHNSRSFSHVVTVYDSSKIFGYCSQLFAEPGEGFGVHDDLIVTENFTRLSVQDINYELRPTG